MTVATATTVSLGLGCSDLCDELSGPLFLQLSRGYEECAVMPLPRSVGDWRAEHRTARKRADRCERRGYRFTGIARHHRVDEIHEINVSAPERQGRPMSAGYRQRPSSSPLPSYRCGRHAIRTYGVEAASGRLAAYLSLYRCGELGLVSQILGHAAHLDDEVMWLLVQGVVESECRIDPDGFLVYNRWDSGTDGLRWFKERCGFARTDVEWLP